MAAKKAFRALVTHRRVAFVALLAVLAGVGAGVVHLESASGFDQFEIGTTEEAKLEYVEANFSADRQNTTVARVVVRDENALDRETLVATLRLQQALRENATVAPTLDGERPTVGLANLVARGIAKHRNPQSPPPGLARQVEILQSASDREVRAAVTAVLSGDGATGDALAFVPSDYEPGSASASATMVAVFQTTESELPPGQASDRIVESQGAIEALATDVAGSDAVVVGNGLLTAENEQSGKDTFQLVGPFAVLFVLGVLAFAYRDVVDVAVSLFGVVLVQVWTFGALGWLGIAFNPILVAIPVLLVGLSIDYGIHVFMRYRERRAAGDDAVAAMRSGLAGVGSALVLVTATTVVGFLSNLASPLGPIRDLGVISAVGIVGALVVFGGFVPLLKLGLDGLLERLGVDRGQTPLGGGESRLRRVLTAGSRAARYAPVAVVAVVLVGTLATTVVAADVSTSFEPEDNVPGDPPAWTEDLPEPLAPGEYSAKADMQYVNDHFVRHDSRAELLVQGDVTDPSTLERVAAAERSAANKSTAVQLADGSAQVQSPLSVVRRVAARNDEVAATVAAADTDGDGVPDRNLEAVYDAVYAAAPEQANRVLHRVDGEYRALRVSIAVDPGADGGEVTTQMRDVAAVLDGDGRTATATGDPVVAEQIQTYLLETLLVSFALTLVAVAAILAVVFRVAHGSATLGLVTVLPVTFAVSWVVASMRALGFPLSVLTTIVASLTVGIGVDYSIHVTERFRQELADRGGVGDALTATVTGTGAALLGSAATTAVGFGVLAFALRPTLQQFGSITAVMIVYAFLASVLVLPSLLALWARYFGPDVVDAAEPTETAVGETPTD